MSAPTENTAQRRRRYLEAYVSCGLTRPAALALQRRTLAAAREVAQ